MKKFILLLLSVFFVLSCKVSLNDTRASLAANIRDDGETPLEEDEPSDAVQDDEYLTSYAKNRQAVMFVSDENFALQISSANKYDAGLYGTQSQGKFYFSSDAESWTDLYEYYGIKEDNNGNIIMPRGSKQLIASDYNGSKLFIPSAYNEDLKKYVIYFKGVGDNGAFKLTFANITSCKVGCYGNIVDLIASDAEDKEEYQLGNYAFCRVFLNFVTLTHAPELPSKNISQSCYEKMFEGCTNLRKAPEILPATVLKPMCYQGMFKNSGIESVPALPALQPVKRCYEYMFYGCENISDVDPDLLKATNLAFDCYRYMFAYSGIRTPLNLNAFNVFNGCMEGMFEGCTNLPYIQLPVLDEDFGYTIHEYSTAMNGMFSGVIDYKPFYTLKESDLEYSYTDFALNRIKTRKVSNMPIYYMYCLFGNYSYKAYSPDFYLNESDKQIVGYDSEVLVLPSPTDTTTFSSPEPFSIISPSGKTWDGSIYYWDGSGYVEWDGKSNLDAVRDCYSTNYVIYMIGNNNVISNGKPWQITGKMTAGCDVTLNLKLGALLSCSVGFIDNDGKKYRKITVADNCFDSWFMNNSAIRKVVIKNDPCSIVSFGKKSFYCAFENSKDLRYIYIHLNKNVETDKYLQGIFEDFSGKSDYAFSRMFVNCPQISQEQRNTSNINIAKADHTVFENMFEITPPPTSEPEPESAPAPTSEPEPESAPAPTSEPESEPKPTSTSTATEPKTATGSTKILKPASTSPKDHAKSGVKKPIKSTQTEGRLTVNNPGKASGTRRNQPTRIVVIDENTIIDYGTR